SRRSHRRVPPTPENQKAFSRNVPPYRRDCDLRRSAFGPVGRKCKRIPSRCADRVSGVSHSGASLQTVHVRRLWDCLRIHRSQLQGPAECGRVRGSPYVLRRYWFSRYFCRVFPGSPLCEGRMRKYNITDERAIRTDRAVREWARSSLLDKAQQERMLPEL